MSKVVKQLEAPVIHQATSLPQVKGWKNTDRIMSEIARIHERLQNGDVDPEVLRLMVANIRNGVALLAIQMDFNKFTGGLKKGSRRLPGFEINSRS